MSDWHLLGRRNDPTPGDTNRIRELGQRLINEANAVDGNVSRLRGIATNANGGDLQLKGEFAPEITKQLGELPGELTKLGKAYRACGNALVAWASELAPAKTKVGRALADARSANGRYRGAINEIRSQFPPDRQSAFAGPSPPTLAAIQRMIDGLTDENAKARARPILQRARRAHGDVVAAKGRANTAITERGHAENRAVKRIHEALSNSGIKNKAFLDKMLDYFGKRLNYYLSWDHFKSWDNFVKLCSQPELQGLALIPGIGGLIEGPQFWDSLLRIFRGEGTASDWIIVGGTLAFAIPVVGRFSKVALPLSRAARVVRVGGPGSKAIGTAPYRAVGRAQVPGRAVGRAQVPGNAAGSAPYRAVGKAKVPLSEPERIHREIDRIARVVNPNRHLPSYKDNCPSTSAAFELQRRGFPAAALPRRAGPGVAQWGDTSLPSIERAWGYRFTHAPTRVAMEQALSQPGARAIVCIGRGEGKMGHIFNLENVGGRIRYVDTQPIPNMFKDPVDLLNQAVDIHFLRIDNLLLRPSIFRYVDL